jgi:secreted trypsin-like serine protease
MKSMFKRRGVLIRTVFFGALVLILSLTVTSVEAINGGEPDAGSHPNVGLMGVFFENQPVGACTATLIDKHLVLTAAHCIENALSFGPGVTVMVSFAEDPISIFNPTVWIPVSQLIPHPQFYWGPTSNPYDIGLLVLASNVTDITPANLPEEGFLSDLKADGRLDHGHNKTQFTVVGYGITLDWPTDPFDIIPQPRQKALSSYRALLKAWLNLSQNEATGDGGSCFGDSGGPVFWTDSEGQETIVGITSWGDPHCVSPSFNYRVDIPDSLNFIDGYLSDDLAD